MSDATLPELTAGGGAAALLSDDRLARRATRGDRRAFAAIYRRYHQPLFRYCAAILGNPDDAHDALQNTMVRVLRALPGERRHVRLKPWLYRIAHNESVELLRRRRPLEQLDPEMVLDEGDPAESAAARERLRRLIGDLDELPERQRGALVMRELGGLSFEQIGEAFSTSPAVARQTVYEARLGLQQMSEGREMLCDEVCRALSDGDRRVARRRDIRAHLRSCEGCRSFREGIEQRRRDLAAIAPLPPLAAVGLFHSLVAGGAAGGAGSGAGAGVTGAAAGSSGLGGSAGGLGAASSFGKAIAGSALLKGAATVAVVAAVGVSAADRSGVIHVLPGEGGGAAKAGGESAPAEGGHGSGSAAAVGGTAGAASTGGASQGTASGSSQGSARKALGHHAPTPATVGQGGQPGSATHGAGGSAAVPGSQGARGAAHGQAAATHGHSGASTAHGQGATRSGEHRSQSHGSSAAAAPGSKGHAQGNAHGKGATGQHQSHSKSKHEAGSNAKHGKGKPPTGSSQATSHQGNPPEAGQTAPQAGSHRGASQVTPPASTPEPEVGVDAPSGPAAAGTLAEGVE